MAGASGPDSATTFSDPVNPPSRRRIEVFVPAQYQPLSCREGGQGFIIFCREAGGGRPLVLKTFKPHHLNSYRRRYALLKEISGWLDLGFHPNVVQALRMEQHGNPAVPYLVLDWVDGQNEQTDASIADLLKRRRRRPLTFRKSLALAFDIATGMAYATQRIPGLVHRDLKPGNILVDGSDRGLVSDFGLARIYAADPEDSAAPAVEEGDKDSTGDHASAVAAAGTPRYMAPEQWTHTAALDCRTDIYAFGLILYEMVTGVSATPPTRDKQVLRDCHVAGRLQPLPDGVPKPLADFITQCLAVEMDQRPAGWDTLLDRVKAIHKSVIGEDLNPWSAAPVEQGTHRESHLALGTSYFNLGFPAEAVQYFNLGLAAESPGVQRNSSAKLYYHRALAFDQLQLPENALADIEAAHDRAAEDASGELEIDILGAWGSIESRAGFHESAIRRLNQAVARTRKRNDSRGERMVLGNLANVHAELGQWSEAIELQESLRRQFEENGDRSSLAACLTNLGMTLARSGDAEAARPVLLDALELASEIGDPVNKGRALYWIVGVGRKLGDSELTGKYEEQLASVSRELGDRELLEFAEQMTSR